MRSVNVLSVVCEGLTRASISGEATIAGRPGSVLYQIDVQDLSGNGRTDTYQIRLPDLAYDSGQQVLRQGNVQIRPN
jgi:hypothetical protein